MRVENPGFKLNPKAFDLNEGELDVFLQATNAEIDNPELSKREEAGVVFRSLEA